MLDIPPLNTHYDPDLVKAAIEQGLRQFYESLTASLDNINLDRILMKKNPYLYRAKGLTNAPQLLEGILSAWVSSSEETIFGNTMFEPIAIAISGGQKAVTEGVDITVDTGGTVYSIAVKSGTSVFNADSKKRQEQNFQAAQKRVIQARKVFVPIIGYGYGVKRIRPGAEKWYKELAGQDFWHWLSGDPDFFTKIIEYMGTAPDEYAARFSYAYDRALNRMIGEFTARFCAPDGAIDWEALIRFNSGSR